MRCRYKTNKNCQACRTAWYHTIELLESAVLFCFDLVRRGRTGHSCDVVEWCDIFKLELVMRLYL